MTFRPVRSAAAAAALAMSVIAAIILINYIVLAFEAREEESHQREAARDDIIIYNEEIQTFAARLDWLDPNFRNAQIARLEVAVSHGGQAREAYLDGNLTGVANQLRFGRADEGPGVLDPLDAVEGRPAHPEVELFGLPSFDLIGAQPKQELAVTEIRVDRFLGP